jgi:hypothetical protein
MWLNAYRKESLSGCASEKLKIQGMFPHKYDRYRVLGYIIRQVREKLFGLTQTELAKKAGVTQGTVSHLESHKRLFEAAEMGRRPIKRDLFIKIAIQGLQFSSREINALLWLTEGAEYEPLRKSESPYNFSLGAATTSEFELHALALELLQKAVEFADPSKNMDLRMLTGWEEKHQITFRKDLLNMERNPGQRLLISKFPTFLTFPQNILSQSEWRRHEALSTEAQEQIFKLTVERGQVFRENLKYYGERCIHSVESLERYVRKDFKHHLDVEMRRAHLRNLIALLKKYEHFEVGLAPAEPEMEFLIKCGWAACLRGTAREIRWNPGAVICGPLYIFWDNMTTVYSFVVDFERAWSKLSSAQRSKAEIIERLESILNL